MKKNNYVIVVGNTDPEAIKEAIEDITMEIGAALIEPFQALLESFKEISKSLESFAEAVKKEISIPDKVRDRCNRSTKYYLRKSKYFF